MKHLLLCSTEKLPLFMSLLSYDFLSLSFFLFSHPLITAYIVLLSTHILKLFFFLSPLLFSTFLLLLTASPESPLTSCSTALNFLLPPLVPSEAKANSREAEHICSLIFPDFQLCGGSMLSRGRSVRKEKEWKRTLACKLFEERMAFKLCEESIGGAEGMDLLWEAYEAESHKAEKKRQGRKKIMEEGEEEEEMSEKLCCLQAVKLRSGKMRFMKICLAFNRMPLFHTKKVSITL